MVNNQLINLVALVANRRIEVFKGELRVARVPDNIINALTIDEILQHPRQRFRDSASSFWTEIVREVNEDNPGYTLADIMRATQDFRNRVLEEVSSNELREAALENLQNAEEAMRREEEDQREEYDRRMAEFERQYEERRERRVAELEREGREDVFPSYRTASSLQTGIYDESDVEGCFDFIMQMDMDVNEIFEEDEAYIVLVDSTGKPFCMTLDDFKRGSLNPSSWIEDCNRNQFTTYSQAELQSKTLGDLKYIASNRDISIRGFANNKQKIIQAILRWQTIFPSEKIYVKTIISAGGGSGIIPLSEVKKALEGGQQILHLKKGRTIEKTEGWVSSRGGGAVSAYHCQDGSNLDVYHIVKCTGPKCRDVAEAGAELPSEQPGIIERIGDAVSSFLGDDDTDDDEMGPGVLEVIRGGDETPPQLGPGRSFSRTQLNGKNMGQLRGIASDWNIAIPPRTVKQQIINAILESQRTGRPAVIGQRSPVRAPRARAPRARAPITSCPAGKELVNGRCLKKCRADQIRNANNRCVKRRAAPRAARRQLSPAGGCVQRTERRYTSRPGPPYHAPDCVGQQKRGNDGIMYEVVRHGRSHRWKKIGGAARRASPVRVNPTTLTVGICPSGKELVNGRCLKNCKTNQYRHPITERCRNR